MKTLTNRIMKNIFAIITTVLCLISLQGCEDSHNVPTVCYGPYCPPQGTQTQEKPAIYFEMPKGWSVHLDEGTAFGTYWFPDKSGYYAVILNIGVDREKGKTDEDAKANASYRDCSLPPGPYEKMIAGKKVYIVRNKDCSHYSDYSSPYSTDLYFEKNGHVITIAMSEDYNHFQPDIEMLVKTISLNF